MLITSDCRAIARKDDGVALRIDGDDANRWPVAGLPTPVPRVTFPCIPVDGVAGGLHRIICPTRRYAGVTKRMLLWW
jgi:hypothetical protein